MTESAHYEQLLRRNQLLADEVARLHRLLADAEDELAERRGRERREQQLEAELAALREGEEPHEEENAVPTPAQWIWRWNRATPESRLAMASLFLDLQPRLNRARQVLAFHGDRPGWQEAMRAALSDRLVREEPVTLTARYLSYSRPACAGCEWAAHPPLTCDEVAAFRDRFDGLLAEQLAEIRNEDQP